MAKKKATKKRVISDKEKANLRPCRTKEEARVRGRAGGKKSGIKRRQNKTFKELAQSMLRQKAPKELKEKVKRLFPELNDEELTAKMGILYSQYGKALKGDTRAFEALRDTAGEKPVNETKITGDSTVTVEIDIKKAKKTSEALNKLLG